MSKFRYDLNAKSVCTMLITNECNISCEFCVADDFVLKNGCFTSVEKIKENIPLIKQKGASFITLSGGEPTLHPEFVKITKLLKENEFNGVCVITNFSNPKKLLEASENLSFIRISLGLRKNKGMIRKIKEFSEKAKCPVRVQVLLTKIDKGFNTIDDIYWLRENLPSNVTIACSSLRLANDFCLKYNTDEDYWIDKGKLEISNRYIVSLEDGTQIVLRNKSLSLTGEDPVEEELVMYFDGTLQAGFQKNINSKSEFLERENIND
jgi:Predicted Fe-S oxidoreductases